MKDFKEAVSVTQRRRQFKRLLTIMGIMFLMFITFVLGMMVGIKIEKKRVELTTSEKIRQKIVKPRVETAPQAPGVTTSSVTERPTKETPVEGLAEKAPQTPPQKEDDLKLTFYETLTKKGAEQTTTVTPKTTGPPTPTQEVKKVKGSEKHYFVRVASFRNKEYAEALKDRLAKQGYDAQVNLVEIPRIGRWYRVRVGAYENAVAAHKAKEALAASEKITDARVVLEE